MNFLGAVVLLVAVAVTNASIIGGLGHGGALIGPSGIVAGHAIPGAIGIGHGGLAGIAGIGGIAGIAGHGLVGSGIEGQVGLVGSGIEGQVGLIGSGIEGQVGLIGSGIEGQWVPDINEHLHDDGSYKPHVYGH